MRRRITRWSGFTLVEMMIAMFVGVIVLGTAVQLYTKGMEASWIVSQRAELQQDARASFNMITKDISLANAGLSDTPQFSGVGLATGAANRPVMGCDYTGACHLGAGNNGSLVFPADTNGLNHLYGVVPGWQKGPTINATVGPTDVITIVYLDTTFLLNNYQVMFNDVNGNSVTFKTPAVLPSPAPQAVNNSAVGLQKGDLVLFRKGANAAIAEVTTAPPVGGGPTYTVSFATASALGFNQNAATSGSLNKAIILSAANVGSYLANTTATRVWVITYYIDNTKTTPTLMKLVNGRLPIPLAENVADMHFLYDTYDDSGNLLKDTGDGGLGGAPPIMPSSIRSITVSHLTVRSQSRGTKGYQAVDLHTSISARNMGFVNRYQ